jgi:hypothetical protein
MKGDVRELAGRFRGNAVAVIAAFLLLFPSSASVLCIAPGGHIEIEDLNAPCCRSFGISTPAGCQPDNGFNTPGICHNCTDFFLTPNARGAVSESCDLAAANPFAAECLEDHLSADISLSPYRSGAVKNAAVTIPVFSSVPLRC